MAILRAEDLRHAKIVHANGGYVVMCTLMTKKLRTKFNGASVAVLSPRSGWIPFKNSVLDECTKKTEKEAKYLMRYSADPFELGGAL